MKPKTYVKKRFGKLWPSKEMKKIAWVNNKKLYKTAAKDPIKFWEYLAENGISWRKKWTKAYEEKLPYFRWFVGGKLNISENCLDRQLEDRADKTALIWIPELVKEKPIKLTYKELHERVCKFANVLKKYGVKKGDVVSIYLPLIPEAAIAMLSCARIGAIHSVVFSAFSADALKTRIKDGKSKILITSDGYYRRGKKEDLIKKAKSAIIGTTIKKVIVVPRLKKKISGAKYLNFNKEIKEAPTKCEPTIVNSEDTMFLLYTSGTTGKPKGIIHDTGGYATQAYWTAKWNFNLHDDDIMWCTADIGWITGHTYAIYGPLLNGATTLLYEGSPDFPKIDRWWKIIEENNISVLYTAPTAIRMFIKAGDKWPDKHKMPSIRILGTVGEPIDEEAWDWYFKKIGKSRCPIIDTWWQTETGGTLINSLPGIGPFIPTIAGRSFPGTNHIIVDENGKKLKKGKKGNLVQTSPFAPGMLHGIYKNEKKYKETYWRFKTVYDTSDGAYLEKHGFTRITGRTDDVMKVAGHRLATAEVENALNDHKTINESAVVPLPDKIKGEVPIAFVVLKKATKKSEEYFEKKLKNHVDKRIGPTARPAKIYIVKDLPKTRSGKIMRRILKAILINEEPKGLSTLVNPGCVENIKKLVSSNTSTPQ